MCCSCPRGEGHFSAALVNVKVKRHILLNSVKILLSSRSHLIIDSVKSFSSSFFNVVLSDSPPAPYKAVTKHLQKAAQGDEVLLSCQSEGYPETSVEWLDGRQQRIKSKTTVVITPEQLYKVTSETRIKSSDTNNYTCSFTNDDCSATFHIPGESLHDKHVRLRPDLLTAEEL